MPDGSVMSYGAAGAFAVGDRKKIDGYFQRFDVLKSERALIEPLWQECAKYILPRKANIFGQMTPGQKRGHELYDDTAVYSNELFGGMLHGMFTNPGTPFFGLGFQNVSMQQLSDGMKEWLQFAGDSLHAGFNRAGLSGYLQELYGEEGCFGTSLLRFDGTPLGDFRLKSIAIDQGWIAENELGLVDTLFRRFQLTARQSAQLFVFDDLPKKVREAAQDPKKLDDKFWYLNPVTPNSDRVRGRLDARGMAFSNCYIAEEEMTLVEERGEHEFPYHTPRWRREPGSAYGSSPGMTCLGTIKMLNEMCKTTLKAAQKLVDPPVQMPDDGFMTPFRNSPGAVNYYRTGEQGRIEPVALAGQGNIALGLEMENQKRDTIRNAFYVDRLQLTEGPTMTATEVMERRDEKLKQMGPMLGRLERELLKPLIERGFHIQYRAGLIPPPPEAPPGKLNIEFLSPLAKLQRQSYLAATNRWVGERVQLAAVDRSAMDVVDLDAHARYSADVMGIPQTVVRDVDAVADLREARAAAQEQAAELAAAQSMAGTMKDGTAALNNAAQAEAAGKQPERARPR